MRSSTDWKTFVVPAPQLKIVLNFNKFKNFGQESNCSLIEEHRLFFQKEKCLYHTMNMKTLDNNIFFGYCWCPKVKEQFVIKTLSDISSIKGFTSSQFHQLTVDPSSTPPTSFELNDFTRPFQVIFHIYFILLNDLYKLSRKLSILMEFQDIEKLTLGFSQSSLFLSFSPSCSETWVMEHYCFC